MNQMKSNGIESLIQAKGMNSHTDLAFYNSLMCSEPGDFSEAYLAIYGDINQLFLEVSRYLNNCRTNWPDGYNTEFSDVYDLRPSRTVMNLLCLAAAQQEKLLGQSLSNYNAHLFNIIDKTLSKLNPIHAEAIGKKFYLNTDFIKTESKALQEQLRLTLRKHGLRFRDYKELFDALKTNYNLAELYLDKNSSTFSDFATLAACSEIISGVDSKDSNWAEKALLKTKFIPTEINKLIAIYIISNTNRSLVNKIGPQEIRRIEIW